MTYREQAADDVGDEEHQLPHGLRVIIFRYMEASRVIYLHKALKRVLTPFLYLAIFVALVTPFGVGAAPPEMVSIAFLAWLMAFLLVRVMKWSEGQSNAAEGVMQECRNELQRWTKFCPQGGCWLCTGHPYGASLFSKMRELDPILHIDAKKMEGTWLCCRSWHL